MQEFSEHCSSSGIALRSGDQIGLLGLGDIAYPCTPLAHW